MSGDLYTAREAITAGIKSALPELRTCETHGGRFDRGELQRLSRRAPAVFVAALGVPSVAETPRAGLPLVGWAAFVIVSDTPQVSRDVIALDYAEALLRLINDNGKGHRWGLDGAQKPERLAADNLYSGSLDKMRVAMWAVTWRQGIHLTPGAISELADFALYSATHLVGGSEDPDAEDRVELPTEPE
ncbi:MAG: hypothetical protein WED00_05685 [Aquisalimonadaceae bacterium]